MRNEISLNEIKEYARSLSPWAHLATVGADNQPDVVPVHPCWEGDTLWTMIGAKSIKAHNVTANPNVALHWQVTEAGDGVELWGTAKLFDGSKVRPNELGVVLPGLLHHFRIGRVNATPDFRPAKTIDRIDGDDFDAKPGGLCIEARRAVRAAEDPKLEVLFGKGEHAPVLRE